MELRGIHHVTAITSSSERIYEFYTKVLGLRLVKKTVNQDDINTYHLFFADYEGNPGTDMTFFDFKGIDSRIIGSDVISKTSFRVKSDEALLYFKKRFSEFNITHSEIEILFGKKVLYFNDFDDQNYMLISDELNKGVNPGVTNPHINIPEPLQIVGLGPSWINVSDIELTDELFTKVLNFRKTSEDKDLTLYEMGEGGNGGSLIIKHVDKSPSYVGYGGVHHVAFRVKDNEELASWYNRLSKLNIRSSGLVDRFYFKSLYARILPHVLFEFATDGPGFVDDEESLETLGTTLALPPKFRHMRSEIEKLIKPLNLKD
mgnify:CR=1 FL=1